MFVYYGVILLKLNKKCSHSNKIQFHGFAMQFFLNVTDSICIRVFRAFFGAFRIEIICIYPDIYSGDIISQCPVLREPMRLITPSSLSVAMMRSA